MNPTSAATTDVAIQPRTLRRVLITNLPITLGLAAMNIIAAIIGAEMTPFRTASRQRTVVGGAHFARLG